MLLIPILLDSEKDNINLFDDNIFYEKWNVEKNNFQLLEYLLPSEDLEDLNKIQEMSNNIENYDFTDLIKRYDLQDYIILIINKNKNEVKTLSKINLNNSLKLDNRRFTKINLENKDDNEKLIKNLKIIYEDQWKKNNEINTSIKLPLTISIDSKNYQKIIELENIFEEIDLISDFYTLKFDSQSTQYKVIYNGSPKFFLNDMKKRNFNLVFDDNIWVVK